MLPCRGPRGWSCRACWNGACTGVRPTLSSGGTPVGLDGASRPSPCSARDGPRPARLSPPRSNFSTPVRPQNPPLPSWTYHGARPKPRGMERVQPEWVQLGGRMSDQPLDLRRSLRILRRHKIFVAASVALGLAGGLCFAVLSTPMLTSNALVVLPSSVHDISTQVLIATSDPVLVRALRTIDPDEQPQTLR